MTAILEDKNFLDKPLVMMTMAEFFQIVQDAVKSAIDERSHNKDTDIMSQEEAAKYLGVSDASMYQYVHKGLPVIKNGKFNTFSKKELDAWFSKRKRKKSKNSHKS